MRILLFSGKGGVGKTSLAAATGVTLAQLGYRTLVMSIDPAHSLADSFDLGTDLFHTATSDPFSISDRLSILELNIQKEVKRHWQEISSYVSSVLRTTGISGVEAEELAILLTLHLQHGEYLLETQSRSPRTRPCCRGPALGRRP